MEFQKLLYELTCDENNPIVTACYEGYKVCFGEGQAYFDVCGTFLRAEGMKGTEELAKNYLLKKLQKN